MKIQKDFPVFHLVIAPTILKPEKLLNLDYCQQVLLFLKDTPKVTKELSYENIKYLPGVLVLMSKDLTGSKGF